MATADLTVIALGRPDPSASRYIAEIQRRLAAQDDVLHAVPFELGIPRVYTILKLDERRDKEQTLEDKVASVQRLLGD
jgi:uncharacterized protein YqgV (UPF0045/DUF77 family)